MRVWTEIPHLNARRTYGARVARTRPAKPRSGNDGWPDQACSDPDAEVVRLLALNVGNAMVRAERGLRAMAREAGIDHGILSRLLTGDSWPNAATIIRLERALGERLWPEHLRPPS